MLAKTQMMRFIGHIYELDIRSIFPSPFKSIRLPFCSLFKLPFLPPHPMSNPAIEKPFLLFQDLETLRKWQQPEQ
jgi:hypothetical protein